MPDSPTPAQILRLRDIVVPEPEGDGTRGPPNAFTCWQDDRVEFVHLSPRDAISELEAIVRAKSRWWKYASDNILTGGFIAGWNDERQLRAFADEASETWADFLAVIRAFIALGMVSEEQAGMIEKGDGL